MFDALRSPRDLSLSDPVRIIRPRPAAARLGAAWLVAFALVFVQGCTAPVGQRAAPEPAGPERAPASWPAAPADLYGELLPAVQMTRVMGDGKDFVDALPLVPPAKVDGAYAAEKGRPGFSLADFVHRHFAPPESPKPEGVLPASRLDLAEHIEALWPVLTRPAIPEEAVRAGDSRLPLPRPYVVPGGRFRELYYWDSYFTLLGLVRSGRRALAEDMVADFAHLIERYGHVPNGTRSYYLSRSQPPFFFEMVAALSPAAPARAYARYLSALQREYAYWMAGGEGLAPGQARRRVVRLPDGARLNRYWDDRDTPREESYREDVLTAQGAGRPAREVYRDLRAGAESGWDFSSRWLADGRTLATIQTTAILPVDLNALLYGLEMAIAQGCTEVGDARCSTRAQAAAAARREAMNRYLWDELRGHYVDYQWQAGRRLPALTAATVVPLFVGLADPPQARRVAGQVAGRLLQRNGLATTLVESGQQWDQPNGWAPLQWMAIAGLIRYGQPALAGEIAARWMRTVDRVYRATGKLMEKYDVTGDRPGGGGEYPTQDGFGWTNGVMVELMARYPEALGNRASARGPRPDALAVPRAALAAP